MNKIDVRKIETFICGLILLAVSAGGWILFARSEINRQKDLTKEINRQTQEILDQAHRRDSAFTAEFKEFDLPPE